MEQKVLHYYSRGLSNYRLIVKKMKLVTFGYLLVTFFNASLITISLYKQILLLFLGAMFIQIIAFLVFNDRVKKFLVQTYHCRQDKLLWDGTGLYTYKLNKLDRFLKRYKIDHVEKLDKLAEILNKDAENAKFSSYIGLGIIVIMFVPLWSEFVGWMYARFDNLSDVSVAILLLFLLALLLWGFIWMLRMLVFDFFDYKSLKMKELALMIERLSLRKRI